MQCIVGRDFCYGCAFGSLSRNGLRGRGLGPNRDGRRRGELAVVNGPWMSSEGESGDVSRVAMWKTVADWFDQRVLGLGVVGQLAAR